MDPLGVEVLQRAGSSEVWQEMGGMGVEMSMARKSKKTERAVSSRSVLETVLCIESR